MSAYNGPSAETLAAEASARVEAADTPTALLRLCLPSVSFDASTGVIGARELYAKMQRVLNEPDPMEAALRKIAQGPPAVHRDDYSPSQIAQEALRGQGPH